MRCPVTTFNNLFNDTGLSITNLCVDLNTTPIDGTHDVATLRAINMAVDKGMGRPLTANTNFSKGSRRGSRANRIFPGEPGTDITEAVVTQMHSGLRSLTAELGHCLDKSRLGNEFLAQHIELETRLSAYREKAAFLKKAHGRCVPQPDEMPIDYIDINGLKIAIKRRFVDQSDLEAFEWDFEYLAILNEKTGDVLQKQNKIISGKTLVPLIGLEDEVDNTPIDRNLSRNASLLRWLYYAEMAATASFDTTKIPETLSNEISVVMNNSEKMLSLFFEACQRNDYSLIPPFAQAFSNAVSDMQERVTRCGGFEMLQHEKEKYGGGEPLVAILNCLDMNDEKTYREAQLRVATKGQEPDEYGHLKGRRSHSGCPFQTKQKLQLIL